MSFKYDYTAREQLLDIFNQNQPSAAQVAYTHNPNGLRTLRVILGKNTWADPNFTTYGYDSATKSRLMSSQHAWSTSQTNWTRDFNYGYDAAGNLTYEMRDWAQQGDGFQYDKNNQITGYEREGTVNTTTGGVSAPQDNDALSFDPSGNRTSVSDNGTTTTYAAANVLNQYTSINGAGLTYDGNGNLASYSGGSFTYNAQNQLTHAVSGANYAYFSYDGFGRICVSQVSGSTGIHINFYDGWNLADEYRTGNTLDAEYLWGEGELVSRRSGGQNVALYYYQDGRGNTSQVADNNAIVQENYKYQLNGVPLISDPNNNPLSDSAIGNRFLYGGQEYFSDLGIINLRNRFYLTSLGRFLQPDPIGFGGDAANLYRYCGNNPSNWSDPIGLDAGDIDTDPTKAADGASGGDTTATFGNGTPYYDGNSPSDPSNYQANPGQNGQPGEGEPITITGGNGRNTTAYGLGSLLGLIPDISFGGGGGQGGGGAWQRHIRGSVFGGLHDSPPNQNDHWRHPITDDTRGVALPSASAAGRWVQVWSTTTGQSITAQVIDSGPHTTTNPYWETNSRPWAESHSANQSGIDLTPQSAHDIGLKTIFYPVNDPAYPYGQIDFASPNPQYFDWRFVPPPGG